MHAVVLTEVFERQAKRIGLSQDELFEIVATIASDPTAGHMIVGTGGAWKVRHAAPGRGKSGGYRTIHYFASDGVPLFLLSVYGKSEKASLTQGEKNELAKALPALVRVYRRIE
jgi:hypothetical protein